jgi:hypothetical protein
MHKRQITLPDGRYLIFYTFEDEETQRAATSDAQDEGKRPEPDAEPEAEDERHV